MNQASEMLGIITETKILHSHLIVFSIKWCIFKVKQNNNKVQIAKAIP